MDNSPYKSPYLPRNVSLEELARLEGIIDVRELIIALVIDTKIFVHSKHFEDHRGSDYVRDRKHGALNQAKVILEELANAGQIGNFGAARKATALEPSAAPGAGTMRADDQRGYAGASS